MRLEISTLFEDAPGPAWAARFRELWPGYRAWFLSAGERSRPTYLATLRALREHMPEIVPVYAKLVELAGASDHAARCLGLYRPVPFLSGCSQAVWSRGEPFVVRNYDYTPALWERTLVSTGWLGQRVMGMSDCLWGLLDGVNQSGLALTLAFGGRKVVGDGFGVPLIIRYVLETCSTTEEAVAALVRLPCHMAYNITTLDAAGRHATVFVGPDRTPVVTQRAVITNHQGTVEWPEHAEATGSVDRLRVLTHLLGHEGETGERFIGRFLEPPTYSGKLQSGFGTLYTAVYFPQTRRATYLWPGYRWDQSLAEFDRAGVEIELEER
jgi:predicted choloylglycine hydrolase